MPDEGILGLLLGGIFLITPIIFILTKHQQKMAMILNQGQNPNALPQPTSEISALKELVHQQSIAIDNLAKSQQELHSELKSQRELSARIGASN